MPINNDNKEIFKYLVKLAINTVAHLFAGVLLLFAVLGILAAIWALLVGNI